MIYKILILSLILSSTIFLSACKEGEQVFINDGNFSIEVKDRTEVDCNIGDEDFVILTFGQSNAENSLYNIHNKTVTEKAFEIYDSKCYLLEDPNLGPRNGTGQNAVNTGTVWTILGDKIIEDGLAPNVYFINIAFGGSSISSWTEKGIHFPYLNYTLEMLKSMNVNLTHIFWHQGESDVNQMYVTKEYYYNAFLHIKTHLRQYTDANIYVARASYCMGNYSQTILEAQSLLAISNSDIFYGPNTDLIGIEFRSDNCHFNLEGAELHANGWLEAIQTD